MTGPKTESVSAHISYEFGRFRLDPVERLLVYDGQPLPLTSKAFDTLLLLIQRRGHLVHKLEIMDKVCADSFVEEHNLVVTISMLRKVLTNGDGEQKYIETVSKQGYRFIGNVSEFDLGQRLSGRMVKKLVLVAALSKNHCSAHVDDKSGPRGVCQGRFPASLI